MANKTTKKEYFGMILEIVKGNTELENFVNHELELLDRKTVGRKPTKAQEENLIIMDTIVEELERIGVPVTISELQEQSEKLNKTDFSNQKLSALIKKMIRTEENPEGVIEKTIEKKKSYFSIIK